MALMAEQVMKAAFVVWLLWMRKMDRVMYWEIVKRYFPQLTR